MSLKLNSVMIGSENPKRLVEFYTKLFGKPGWEDKENDWGGWQIGTCSLMVGPHSEVKGQNQQPGRVIIGFEAEDVTAEFEKIKAMGVEVIAEPYNPMPEDKTMWLATFADPDGNYLQLASPWKE